MSRRIQGLNSVIEYSKRHFWFVLCLRLTPTYLDDNPKVENFHKNDPLLFDEQINDVCLSSEETAMQRMVGKEGSTDTMKTL